MDNVFYSSMAMETSRTVATAETMRLDDRKHGEDLN